MAIILLYVHLHDVNPAFSTLTEAFIARLRIIVRKSSAMTATA